ncbi:MAG: HAMP domain-containing histidine kinase [Oscillospiraceae bacterium]|nr:HAMP domain-containing histidine kinase [Oscillospiraceae bacterium]
MTEKRSFVGSLRQKYLLATLLGAAVAVLIYLGLRAFGGYMIDEVYLSSENVARRKAHIYSQFSSYISAEGITGRDSAAVARWTASHDYVTIFLFDTGRSQQLYAGGEIDSRGAEGYDPSVHGKLYPIRFADGLYQIAIDDSSYLRQRQVVKIVSLIGAGLCFLILEFWYTSRLTRRIISLSREANKVSSGELDRSIPVVGVDELSNLAASMEEMRRSVIERLGSEKRAWEANTELITSVSHDIRTPMTSLIGYLELLRERGGDADARQQFLDSAYGKAIELKDLTDQLFRYFLIYGKAEPELALERVDALVLLGQLLGEAEFDLTEAGFSVQRIDFEGDCTLTVDPVQLKRVMDNLVSNIKKYADPARPVVFLSQLTDGALSLSVSNTVSLSAVHRESTKIGLRTCEKILSALGGSFTTHIEDGHFAAELTLPTTKQ